MIKFKFKKKDKLVPIVVGMYYCYSNSSNIFKIRKIDVNKFYVYSIWLSDVSGIIKTSGLNLHLFKEAIINGTYNIIPEEEYYRIPTLLKEYKE